MKHLKRRAILGASASMIPLVAAEAFIQNFTINVTGTGGSAPQITSAQISGSVVVGNVLSITNLNVTGSYTSIAYSWRRNSSTQVGTSSTYTTQVTDEGNTITCTLTPTGAGGTGSPFTTAAFGPITTGGSGTPTAITVQYPVSGTNYTYDPNATTGGAVTVTVRAAASDPFVQLYGDTARYTSYTRTTVERADCPLRCDFCSIPGTGWWSVEFSTGEYSQQYAGLQDYAVTIAGNTYNPVFGMVQGCRWRWVSTAANNGFSPGIGAWPFSLKPSSAIIAAGYFPQFDVSLTSGATIEGGYTPYTPMCWVSLGLAGFWEQAGPRAEIGLCSEYTAQYLCMDALGNPAPATYRTAITGQLFAVAEAAASPSIYPYDKTTGCLIDGIVTYPGASWPAGFGGGTFSPAPSVYHDTYPTVQVTLTGTPGTVIPGGANNFTVTCKAASPDLVPPATAPGIVINFFAGGGTIPSSGTLTLTGYVTDNNGDFQSFNPTGSTINDTSGLPAGVSQVSFSQFTSGGAGLFQTAHMGEYASLAFLLTGDWYYLQTVQGFGMSSYFENAFAGGRSGSYPGTLQLRGAAWATRAIKRAADITPSVTPSWVLPKTTWNNATYGLPFLASIAETVISQALRAQMFDVFHYFIQTTLNDNFDMWMFDYFVMCCCDAYMYTTRVSDPSASTWLTLIQYLAPGVFNRINGSSGWGGDPAQYSMHQPNGDSSAGPPFYNTWNTAYTGAGFTNPPPLASNTSFYSSYVDPDYLNSMRAVLHMMTQALPFTTPEYAQAQAILDVMEPTFTYWASQGTCEYKWALKRQISVSGNVVNVGPTRTYTTIAAGLAAANTGDTVYVDAGTYNEANLVSKSIRLASYGYPTGWIPGQTTAPTWSGGAVIDGTGISESSTPHQYGGLVPAANCIISGFGFTNWSTSASDGFAAMRPYSGCSWLALVNNYIHGNVCDGFFSGTDGPATITFASCLFTTNGLSDGLSHNAYVNASCTQLNVINSFLINPTYANSLKYRGAYLNAFLSTFESPNGYCIDRPNGGSRLDTINQCTIRKVSGASNPNPIGYGEEGASTGTAGMEFTPFNIMDLNVAGGQVIFGSTSATLTWGVTYTKGYPTANNIPDTTWTTTNYLTASGSGTLVGVP